MDAEQRRAELVLAAAEGTLDDAGRALLDELRAQDPGVDEEVVALRATLDRIRRPGAGWDESAMDLVPDAGLLDTVLARTEGEDVDGGEKDNGDGDDDAKDQDDARLRLVRPPQEPSQPRQDRPPQPGRRGLLLGLAAAGLVATGAVGSDVLRRARPDTPTGPPGTLGALEPLSMSATGTGARIEAGLIAHTWGTETVLVVDGADPGARYELVLLTADGTRVPSGGFVGTAAPLDCEMNAAVLREDATEIRILGPDGTTWTRAALPAVST
ncbi:hypothetical protein [Serinicoccus sp. LYQ131]|uniref:hypothetical protein n=1 Tax=Serinicoccus sp. LYQ131 TaxID=3378797 RepID=UPI003852DC36